MNTPFIFSSAVALALAHSLWQCALFALLAAFSFWVLRNAGAKWRHTVGMFWMMAMLLAPLVTFCLCWQSPKIAPSLLQHDLNMVTLPFSLDAIGNRALLHAVPPWADWLLVAVAQFWLVGVVIMLLLQYGGWRLIRRIEQQPFQALPRHWQQRIDALQAALGITRTISVRLANHVIAPFTTHVLRPIIWLPASFLSQLPPDQIEALLLHELAHIQRLDWVWNWLQCLIEAILFYHPGMWWLSRRIRQEREFACDDLAVAACGDAIALAEALAALQVQQQKLQRSRQSTTSMSPRFGLAADGGSLMKRIQHLLSDSPKLQGWWVPGALLLLFCSGSLLAMQVDPPEHYLTNLQVQASSGGALTPGNYREYTASYFPDKKRYYRVDMNAQGKLIETYKEDGQTKPLTNRVRNWIGTMTDMNAANVPPAPPLPPEPPELAEIAALPALPAQPALPALPALPARAAPPMMAPPPPPPPPPAPPPVTETEEFKNMMVSVFQDQRLVAITGSPVKVEDKSFHGSIHTWGSRDFHLWGIDDPVGGKADFSVAMVGPKGRATVAYTGKTENGKWQTSSLLITPLEK